VEAILQIEHIDAELLFKLIPDDLVITMAGCILPVTPDPLFLEPPLDVADVG
jgi:hypothetical protein